MPVVKGGVWTNIEDEILKASVSKYGLNQWARVSSLLARKTPKQCKARWSEWLDPGIRKIEWSKEEDEKLLHLAKLMPTQWRTIAPIVGRTATQCLERYQKLLDEAEARENDELGLGGPEGGETHAPSADDVRRLRPGELDPDPESKPARPDTIDLDEDEKEMLSEARARLANTQGKKAKRKARERQLEESRRLAVLQKRRELKNAGINIKIVTRKAGQMDYNADIPFEKAPASGFFDTQDEEQQNERQREAFDPRKQQLANKRKNEQQDDGDDRKKRKGEKNAPSSAFAAAAKAGQMQKVREAERNSKRRALVLPAPQVGESELENIVKMGMAGERAAQTAGGGDNEATRGLISDYSNMVGSTPLRTPRAPQEEDRVANEIRDARARTAMQSALLGGENTPLHEGQHTTGLSGAAPGKHVVSTPNPMATPFRHAGAINGATGATPMRTPRDNFRLNDQTPGMQLVGQTPRELKLAKTSLQRKLAALPKPKESEWDLELPEEQQERDFVDGNASLEEDAAARDARELAVKQAAERAEAKRQTLVIQRSLPRPKTVDVKALLASAHSRATRAEQQVAEEAVWLMANDARKFGGAQVYGPFKTLDRFEDKILEGARAMIVQEVGPRLTAESRVDHPAMISTFGIPGLLTAYDGADADAGDDVAILTQAFEATNNTITRTASESSTAEKKLATLLTGYAIRNKTMRAKTISTAETLAKVMTEIEVCNEAFSKEQAAVMGRLEGLREDVAVVMRRERVAQELFRQRKMELEELNV